jgi:hypothetical protein
MNRSTVTSVAPLLLVVASLASAAPSSPTVTPPTPEVSTAATASPAASLPSTASSVTLASSPPPPTPRRTPKPSATPEPAADVDATPVEDSDAQEDDASVSVTPAPPALPTSQPLGGVRAFRTPEREDPPAFVAPDVAVPAGADGVPDASATESMPPADQPYIATVTFRAVASTALDGFELMIIYPRAAGDFVGNRNGVDCRRTGDATLFADDHEDGMLRVLVASSHALTFPFDVVCKFTVAPNASLTAPLIAVNVDDVTLGGNHEEVSALTVTVLAH